MNPGIASLLLSLQMLLPISSGQLIESVSVLENSEVGSTVYDLRERLLQSLSPEVLANVSAYAAQQDLFWPFTLKDLKIVLGRPLDREAICERQSNLMHNRQKQPMTLTNRQNEDTCPAYHCCQLLHVNVVISSTSPPQVFFIRVAVQDVNDNSPIFSRVDVPFAVIPEDVSVGHRIFLPQATDADSEQYGVVHYRISKWIQGNESDFKLNFLAEEDDDYELPKKSNRPFLSVAHPLDREKEEVYEFALESSDGGSNLFSRQISNQGIHSSSVIIVLHVKDINDNAPVFNERIYTAVVHENTRPQKLSQFKLHDLDAGENGRVFVNIFDPMNHTNNLFRVVLQSVPSHDYMGNYQSAVSRRSKSSSYTGHLQLLDYLDAEMLPPRLRFFLIATDNGQPQLSSKVEVNIELINVNDQSPNIVFLQEGKQLTENRLILPEILTPPGSIVAEIHVTDGDSNLAQLSCRITREADAFDLFEVTALNGQARDDVSIFGQHLDLPSTYLYPPYRQFSLRTKEELDRERRPVYLVSFDFIIKIYYNLQIERVKNLSVYL